MYHDFFLAGHQGPYRTAMTIRQKFFIHNLMNKVKRYIEACHLCLKTKPKYNPNPTSDDIKLNDNALHQQICTQFNVDYLEEMDIIKQTKRQIEQKINMTLPALLPNKIIQTSKGLVAATGLKGQLHFGSREKRVVPVMANSTSRHSNRRNFD